MKILAFDTSAKVTSVAAGDESSLFGEMNANAKITHSQSLMPMAKSLLDCLGMSFSDIGCFAVSAGPGSFTGLRIGIGAVKGLAFGSGCPCIGVSTLDGLSHNLPGADGIICAAMDARCNQVYAALFESGPALLRRRTEDMALTLDELQNLLQKEKKNIFLVGDGAELCYNYFTKKLTHVYLSPEASRYQRASGVLAAAREKWSGGETVSAAELSPIYLRLPQAERVRLKKQEESHAQS